MRNPINFIVKARIIFIFLAIILMTTFIISEAFTHVWLVLIACFLAGLWELIK